MAKREIINGSICNLAVKAEQEEYISWGPWLPGEKENRIEGYEGVHRALNAAFYSPFQEIFEADMIKYSHVLVWDGKYLVSCPNSLFCLKYFITTVKK